MTVTDQRVTGVTGVTGVAGNGLEDAAWQGCWWEPSGGLATDMDLSLPIPDTIQTANMDNTFHLFHPQTL